MSKDEKIILDRRIPIRLIPKPFCLKCMDTVDQGNDLCHNCKELRFSDYLKKEINGF